MAQEFRLPDIGEGLVEAEIVAWRVAVGEPVAMDQVVVEVESDKAQVEMPSPYAGVLLHQGANAGEILPVGEILFVIGDEGESWRTEGSEASSAPPRGGGTQDPAPIVGTLPEEAQLLSSPAPAPSPAAGERSQPPAVAGPTGRQRSLSPLVRRLAVERCVDLDTVVGTGPGGRITRDDVLVAADHQATGRAPDVAGAAPAAVPGSAPAPGGATGGERRPLSRLRRTIAANMTRSWSEIPHVSSFYDVDASRLLAVRASLHERHGVRVPMDALAIAAVVPALRSFPELNASLDGDQLVLHGRYDIGIAVDTPEGLIVAVVRDAGSRGLLDLAAEVRRLGEAARNRSLAPGEVTGQTFTVSNVGAVAGGGHGTPIVPPGTVGILAVGRAVEKPVARDGRVEVAPVMPLSVSYDHRVIDGAVGRRFMTMVVENLAEPALLLT